MITCLSQSFPTHQRPHLMTLLFCIGILTLGFAAITPLRLAVANAPTPEKIPLFSAGKVYSMTRGPLVLQPNREAVTVFLTTPCYQSKIYPGCLARQALLDLSRPKTSSLPRATQPRTSGGVHPGSSLCTERLKGRVLFAQDSRGNTENLCQFSDGSLTSYSSLMRAYESQFSP